MSNNGMRNMTEGSALRHIMAFALPMTLGGLLQQMYNMVDSWVVGNYVGNAALAAVGMAMPIMSAFISLFIGISTGATVVVAQNFGAGRMDRVRDSVDTITAMFLAAIVPLTVLSLVVMPPLLRVLNVSDSAWDDTLIYMQIICAGLAGNIGYNLTSGILSGVGNSKSSLLFLGTASVVNIVLDLSFVLLLHWDAMGVALATIISQAVSFVMSVVYINVKYPDLAIRPRLKLDREIFRQVMKIGVPGGIQMTTVSLGMMIVISKVNTYGEAFMAGYNVGGKVDSVTFLLIMSVCSAATSFVGQNIGAHKPERVRRGVGAAVAISVVWCFITMAVIVPLREPIIGLFSPDAEVIYAGGQYLLSIMLGYPLFAIMFVINGALRGAGESVFPMVTTIVSMIILRVPAVYWFADHYGRGAIFYGFVPGWAVGVVMACWCLFFGGWRKKMAYVDENPAENAGNDCNPGESDV